jgi:hypothetical protein
MHDIICTQFLRYRVQTKMRLHFNIVANFCCTGQGTELFRSSVYCSEGQVLLEISWDVLRNPLPKCLGHIARACNELGNYVIRRRELAKYIDILKHFAHDATQDGHIRHLQRHS